MDSVRPGLTPFDEAHAALVLSWVADADELERWCGRTDHPLHDDTLRTWHGDDVTPFVLCENEEPVAYGEVWVDHEEHEVELARLIVAPAARNRGIGRHLVHELLRRARRHALPTAYMRVHPENRAALRCYAAAGFQRVSADEEEAFNQGQPRAYVWLRRSLARAD